MEFHLFATIHLDGPAEPTMIDRGSDNCGGPGIDDCITWDESIRIGIATLDQQHHDIIVMLARLRIEAVVGADRHTCDLLLSSLVDKIHEHCLHEEQFMRGHRHHKLQQHISEHNKLFGMLGVICNDYQKRCFRLDEHAVVALWKWLREHMENFDLDLRSDPGKCSNTLTLK